MEFTSAAVTLLHYLADEGPSASLDDVVAATGLGRADAELALRDLCEAGYAQKCVWPRRAAAGLVDLFEITGAGRRIASRLD